MTRTIFLCLAPVPVAGVVVPSKNTTQSAKSASKNTTFLCKTNPILCPFSSSEMNLSPFTTRSCDKIYIFVESQKQTQFKPNSNPKIGFVSECNMTSKYKFSATSAVRNYSSSMFVIVAPRPVRRVLTAGSFISSFRLCAGLFSGPFFCCETSSGASTRSFTVMGLL